MSKLGQPTPGSNNGPVCEEVKLPYECVNDTAAPITVTCDEIVAKAIAGALANGQTFPSGAAITGAAPQTIHAVSVCVACLDTPVKQDDGSVFVVTCDAGSVCVNPNGGTNGTAYSCGATAQLGGGPLEPGEELPKADTVEILPGGALTGDVSVANCEEVTK